MTRRMLFRMAFAVFALALFQGCDRDSGGGGSTSNPSASPTTGPAATGPSSRPGTSGATPYPGASGATASGGATVPTTRTGTNSSAGGKTFRIAVIPKGTTHLHWRSVEAGARKAAAELGAEVIWKGPLTENDVAQQIGLVEQFTQEGVDGIAVAPLDATQLQRPIRQAAAKGIPVVIFDSSVNGTVGKDFISYVATDNKRGGVLGGEELARLLGGKGKVVMVRYNVGSASTDQREAGFLEVMAKNPGIQIIEKSRYAGATVGEAQRNAENMIDKLREADGIFCPNESSTQGFLNVLKANGLTGKKVFVGFDASPSLVSALKAGEVQALVAQNPLKMGYETVRVMVAHLKGEKVDQNIDTGCGLVTKATLETPEIKGMLGQGK
jgi:ribose transport system substrate-binding protein